MKVFKCMQFLSISMISIEMCTCSASGDPHYRTYDGQMIHFMGVCKYTMTKSLTKNDPCAFSVEVKNEHRGRNRRVAYTRAVDVRIYGKLVRLAPGHKVYVRLYPILLFTYIRGLCFYHTMCYLL